MLSESIDLPLFVNVFGLITWTSIWGVLNIHETLLKSSKTQSLLGVYFAVACLFVYNIFNSDTTETDYTEECRLKSEVESNASSLRSLIVTVALCSQIIIHPTRIKPTTRASFNQLFGVSLLLTCFTMLNISSPKKAEKIRILRKLEECVVNIAIGLVCTGVMMVLWTS